MNWQLQEAKNKFSEVVKRAASEGPQTVTVRGKPAAIVMTPEAYDALKAKSEKTDVDKPGFVDFLLSGPPWPDDFVEAVNDRDKSPMRDIEF